MNYWLTRFWKRGILNCTRCSRNCGFSCLLTAAVKSYREGQPERGRQYIDDVMTQGGWLQGLVVWLGTSALSRRLASLTGGQTAARPNWIKRLGRRILRG